MARYPSGLYARPTSRIRRWIYLVSALVIIVVVIVFACYPFGKSEDETVSASASTSVEKETPPPVVMPPKLAPTLEPESELKLEPAPAPTHEPKQQLSEVVPEPASEPGTEAAELIAEAMACVNARPPRIIEARDRLNEILPMAMSSPRRAFVKEQLSELADKWLYSRTIFPQDNLCGSYKVRPGDQLRIIGEQHKVPYEILMEINNISRPEALQAGETIKVINGSFHARIYRSTFTLDLYLKNTFVRSFPVGLGKSGRETPTGLWRVAPGGKLIKPTWTDPDTGRTYDGGDSDYPLGSRWIALEGIKGDAVNRTGIAIHGTKDPEQIGTAGSRGCIRLNNGDAILIYNSLVPGFSQVEVME